MRVRFIKLLCFTCLLILSGCSSDDPGILDNITTVRIHFVNQSDSADTETAGFSNANGQETAESVVLRANSTYTVRVEVFDESDISVNLTPDIRLRATDYRAFLSGSNGQFTPTDRDENGNPIGLTGAFTTAGRATGSLSFSLYSNFNKEAYEARQASNAREFGTLEIDFSNALIILP